MPHPDRASDSSEAYRAFVADGIDDCYGHLIAASLAFAAEADLARAAATGSAHERAALLAAADTAREDRDFHELMADGESAFESAVAA